MGKYNLKYVGAFRSIDGQSRTIWDYYQKMLNDPQHKEEWEARIDKQIDDVLLLVDKFKESQDA